MNQVRKSIAGLLVLFPFILFGQTVDFSFSTDNNLYCSPQRVTFTQNCSGTPDGFIWRFGNGSSGIQPIESSMYFAPGTYSVTLIAIYPDIAISVTKNVVINPTPAISIIPDKVEICQPGIINFVAPGSPTIVNYEWNFGDGSPLITTPTNTVSHFFATYDDFIVKVKGITGVGCSSMAQDTVKVSRFSIIDGNVDPPGGCIPIPVTFDVIAVPPTGDPAVNYTWDFGDGSPLANTIINTATHTYTITTPITAANVIITTASGCTSQFTYPLFGFGIPPTNPVAVTEDGRSTYCASEVIKFKASATGANYYYWDYGDGNNDSVQTPDITHKYRSLGLKRVIMTPFFNGCPGTIKDTIYLDIIGVVADYESHNLCNAKNKFIFDNLSLGNVSSFRWTFSDLPASPDIVNFHTSHTFPTNGSFTAQFYLYDDITGCSDSLMTNHYTATPVLTISRSRVCKDSLLIYDVLNPYPAASGYLYAFHISGGAVAHTLLPQLLWEPYFQGVFNEYVVIKGPTGTTCDDTIYLPNPTVVGAPVLDFTIPINSCFLNNSFPITNNSFPFFPADSIVRWDWDFGDNTFSNLKTPPPHSYTHPGTFWLHFQATDKYGCAQKDSQLLRVYPTPEIHVLPRADTLCKGDSLTLLAFTIDNLQWTTNYNISCLSCDTTLVKPAITTDYVAQAMNIFGCTNTDTAKIKVYEPFVLQVSPADTALCIGGKVQFRANVNGIASWSPPDFLSSVDIVNPLSIPDTSISYQVILRDSASCFTDTTTAIIRVNYKPTIDAGADQTIPFYNSFTLSPAYSTDVVSYRWSPVINSLSCTSCPVTSGIASQSTSYTIEATNMHGCKAKDEVAVTVACNKANLNLPNAFTPDNDGLNDQFYPLTRGYKLINKFVIYNRWGNKVFERHNFIPNIASLGWNGTTKGNLPVDSGVFVWMIEATCDLGQVVQSKGTVALVR